MNGGLKVNTEVETKKLIIYHVTGNLLIKFLHREATVFLFSFHRVENLEDSVLTIWQEYGPTSRIWLE